MASPNKSGSTKYEIVARRDGYCVLCRGRTHKGSRIWWDQGNGTVHHVECPPVVTLAGDAYSATPVTPDRWKHFCKQIIDAMSGENTIREVISEDVEAEACGAPGGMLVNVMKRTRCSGHEAIEIVRKWKDGQRVVDEGKFQKLNQSIRESNRQVRVAAAD